MPPWSRSSTKNILFFLTAATLMALATDDSDAQVATHYIDNGSIRVGVNQAYGGSISFLSFQGGVNWIDNGVPDPGRQVQVSFYTSGQSYPTCWPCNSGCNWGWNPVQSGSCQAGSGTQTISANSSSIYSMTQPLQWDKDLGRSNVVVEQYLSFAAWNAVRIDYGVRNNEGFSFGNGSSHEFPVAYFEPVLDRPYGYIGDIPWAFKPATQLSVSSGVSTQAFPTERWTAWLNSSGKGLALYVPRQRVFNEWRLTRLGSKNVPYTNLIQNWSHFSLAPSQQYTASFYLVAGTVTQIQETVYAIEAQNRRGWIDLGVSISGSEISQIEVPGDGLTVPIVLAGVDCRISSGGSNEYTYFNASSTSISASQRYVILRFSYFDSPSLTGKKVQLQYRSTGGLSGVDGPTFQGSSVWKVYEFFLENAKFDSGLPGGADFRLRAYDGSSTPYQLAIDRAELHVY